MPNPEKELTRWERATLPLKVASVYLGNIIRKYAKYRILLAPLAAWLGFSMKPSTGEAAEADGLAVLDVDAGDVLGDNADGLLETGDEGINLTTDAGVAAPETLDVDRAIWFGLEDITGEQLLSDLETVRRGEEREALEEYLLAQGFTQEHIDEGLRMPEPGEYDPASTSFVSEANLPPLGPFDPAGKPLWEIQRRIVDLNIWEQWHRERAFDDAGNDDWDGWQRHEGDADDLWNERWDLENIANEIIRRQRKPDDSGEEPSQFREWPRVVGEFVKDCLHPRAFAPGLLIIAGAALVWLMRRRQRAT